MTREEVIKLLNWIAPNYPNARITDARKIVDTWTGAFSNTPYEDVYKAVVLHISNKAFFPTIADINQHLKKVQLLYNDSPRPSSNRITSSSSAYIDDKVDWIMEHFQEGGDLGYN